MTELENRCQRPKRAFCISTNDVEEELLYLTGVNALNGLSVFLQGYGLHSTDDYVGVNALNGLSVFLP